MSALYMVKPSSGFGESASTHICLAKVCALVGRAQEQMCRHAGKTGSRLQMLEESSDPVTTDQQRWVLDDFIYLFIDLSIYLSIYLFI